MINVRLIASKMRRGRWASLTPAKVIGADNAKGSLAADKDADILNIAKRPEYS